ncbi:MAG TPA: HAD family hydrolase [Vicinamibacterales bacterium]|nr:HAD family hydrolase [Vicinamibacterales bacterium]
MRPAIFLDRDGTIIVERNYLDSLDKLALFPWTVDALRLLRRAGFVTAVITNQSAVARGLIEESFVLAVHAEIDRRLEGTGAALDRYYYCPHFVESKIERYRQECGCRKPAPGMILQACREMDLDPSKSVMVGDRWLDVACGRAAGTRAVLVQSGPDRSDPPNGVHADAILSNLMEAVGWILRSSSRS